MDIKNQAIKGIKWTTISTVILSIAGILRVSILTRFLDKTDFGLMALVVFVLGFMNLFMDMGLTTAILYKQNITKKEYSSTYWFNVIISIVLFLFVMFATPFISQFYNEKELLSLLPLMGVSLMFSAFGHQFKTIEQKSLNFKFIAIVDIIAVLISIFTAIVLAVNKFGVYSLVLSALCYHLVSNLIFMIHGIKKHGLLFHFNYKEAKPFLKIGIYQVGSEIANYLNRDFDILIIGKMLGTEILGGYSLAKQLVRRPLSLIDVILTKVIVAVFPMYQNDNNKLRIFFNKVLVNLSIIDAIVYGAIAIAAPSIVSVLYGHGYDDIILNVRLFTVVVYLRSLTGQMGVLVITKGKTKLSLVWNIMLTFILPIVIYLGALTSIINIIIYLIVLHLLLLVPVWKMFFRALIEMPWKLYLLPIIRPLIIAAFVFALFSATNMERIFFQMVFIIALFVLISIYAYFHSIEFQKLFKGIGRYV